MELISSSFTVNWALFSTFLVSFPFNIFLNIAFVFKTPRTYWIDVCQNNGNLLATGGWEKNIKIFDKRELKIVKTFEGIHSGNII